MSAAPEVQVRHASLSGRATAPGSKSVTHRAFLLAAQAPDGCDVRNPLLGADTRATLACLHAMGARMHLEPEATHVRFLPAPLAPPRHPLQCANSGSTLRLLSATCARLSTPVILDGDMSLRHRPNQPLLDALRSLGARVEAREGRAPVRVQGPIRPGLATLPAGVSSQYASALLLALPFLDGPSRLVAPAPLRSAPYLDVTAHAAKAAGLRFEVESASGGRSYSIPGEQRVRATSFDVDGDWSTAAILLGAAAVAGGEVTVQGLDHSSPQGDRAILGLLESFGAKVATGEGNATVAGPGGGAPAAAASSTSAPSGGLVSPGTVDVRDCPDLFPILAVLAAAAKGTTTLSGADALREKESDRIDAMAQGLGRMGITARQGPASLVIEGGALRGARVASHGDHRIHMAFCVAGLAAGGITTVDDPACAGVSFPGFHDVLKALGAPLALKRPGAP